MKMTNTRYLLLTVLAIAIIILAAVRGAGAEEKNNWHQIMTIDAGWGSTEEIYTFEDGPNTCYVYVGSRRGGISCVRTK